MGVVNVTPDSFSDGGRFFDQSRAIGRGRTLVEDGADLVDVGGESTRPGADRVPEDEELRRVVPVVRELADAGHVVSVDTTRVRVAERALEAGAQLINDVSGGRAEPDMLRLAADSEVPIVIMHWRQHAATMQRHTDYDDLVADVVTELSQQVDAAVAAGVALDRVVVDPGLGFSKTGDQNWELLGHLDAFVDLDLPVLVAASRKGFLGDLLAQGGEPPRPRDRDDATAAISTYSALAGAWAVRVHDAKSSASAVRVAARLIDELAAD
ncbi:dihydropteroate synthase [Aeromicrobium massiliense]|uniref:dihydropteroate synthase n=1 Tax=Aeromicrobium massiliense TaxID=1464554 RepID=UPI00067478D4|nr:dihydropteroate synthase [Aeromicrobium massiliense]